MDGDGESSELEKARYLIYNYNYSISILELEQVCKRKKPLVEQYYLDHLGFVPEVFIYVGQSPPFKNYNNYIFGDKKIPHKIYSIKRDSCFLSQGYLESLGQFQDLKENKDIYFNITNPNKTKLIYTKHNKEHLYLERLDVILKMDGIEAPGKLYLAGHKGIEIEPCLKITQRPHEPRNIHHLKNLKALEFISSSDVWET
jgi:hypothetical protein